MKATQGKANPGMLQDILKRKLLGEQENTGVEASDLSWMGSRCRKA